LEALRGLLQAAKRENDTARCKKIADEIVKAPQATFYDWLVKAEFSFETEPGSLGELLETLTGQAKEDPQKLGLIAEWLRKNGQMDSLDAWLENTPIFKKDPMTAQMIRFEIRARNGDWKSIVSLLEDANWGSLDYLRLAFMARALGQQSLNLESTQAWHDAVSLAMDDPGSIRRLADVIHAWPGWGEQYTEILWKCSTKGGQNLKWSLDRLFIFYQTARDTKSLLRVSEAMLVADPTSITAKNQATYYSLLRDSPTAFTPASRVMRQAKELFQTSPDDPTCVSTYALALVLTRHPQDAVDVLEKFQSPVLSRNEIAPCYAMALAGAGQMEKARTVAAGINRQILLPEEQALLKKSGL
jgi:hypothetical protein